MSNRRYFSKEYKLQILKSCEEESVLKIAKQENIGSSLIYQWQKKLGEEHKPGYQEIRQLKKTIKRQALEIEILKKASSISSEDREGLFQFIKAHADVYPLCLMCSLLGYKEKVYYRKLKYKPSTKLQEEDEKFTVLIKEEFDKSKERYGYKRVRAALKRRGYRISKRRVHRIMRANGWKSKLARRRKKRKTTQSEHSYQYAPNLLAYKYQPERLNEVWVSDITYLRVGESWTYLTTIMDLYNREIVGWSLSNRLYTNHTVVLAWKMAIQQQHITEPLIFHSDRGVQYASNIFKKVLKENPQVAQSMSAKGYCWDNPHAESFFKTLKYELAATFDSHHEVFDAVSTYIAWYSKDRLHSELEDQPPMELRFG